MDILQALSDNENKLTELEKRLAALVLDNINAVIHGSIVDLAERAQVSPPTVTRFCRSLGCKGFSHFKVELAQIINVGVRFVIPETQASTPAEIVENVITNAQSALYQIQQNLDYETLDRAAKLLRGAEYVLAFGAMGNSAMIASELYNRLFRIGCRVHSSTDHSMNIMASTVAEKGTVVICSSFTGLEKDLLRCLKILKERCIPTIVMTKSNSPIAALADTLISIDIPEHSNVFRPTATRYAYLAVIDILSVLVGHADKALSLRLLRNLREELILHRGRDSNDVMGD